MLAQKILDDDHYGLDKVKEQASLRQRIRCSLAPEIAVGRRKPAATEGSLSILRGSQGSVLN